MSEPAAKLTGQGPDRPSTLSALICAYTLERWTDIERAIDSLHGQTRAPDEILLVVDHNPELMDRATAAFEGVRVISNSGPQGLSGARNTGVAAAIGDIVGFLDDDAAADAAWVECMLAAYDLDDVIGAGGWVRPRWQVSRPAWFPEEFLWVVGCSYKGLPTQPMAIRNPIGANMSFRRRVLTESGAFDTAIGRLGKDAAGCEETEFSIRAKAARTRAMIVQQPSAICDHTVTADRVTRRYFRERCRAEGRSKALVSELAGVDAALATERSYVRRVLPAGVVRGLRDVAGGDPSGGARAFTILEGAALTACAYVGARWRMRRTARLPPAFTQA